MLYFFIGLLIFIINGLNQNYHYVNISSFWSLLMYGTSSAVMIFGLIYLKENTSLNQSTKLLTLLGASSYSIYLIHVPLLSILNRIVLKLDVSSYLHPNLLFLFLGIGAICGGVIMHLVFEKPITFYLRQKFLKK